MPTRAEGVARPLPRRVAADLRVRPDRLDHLRVDAQQRVQGHHGVLEDHGDARSAQPREGRLPGRQEVLAVEHDPARGDAAGLVDQADDGEAGDGLAGPRFADQAEDLAAPEAEIDTVHRSHDPGPGGELGVQSLDAQQLPARLVRMEQDCSPPVYGADWSAAAQRSPLTGVEALTDAPAIPRSGIAKRPRQRSPLTGVEALTDAPAIPRSGIAKRPRPAVAAHRSRGADRCTRDSAQRNRQATAPAVAAHRSRGADRCTRDSAQRNRQATAPAVAAHRCSLGLRMSRSSSPTRLMATTVMSSATPGDTLIHG